MQDIFKKEFKMSTLIEGRVIYEHFMPHTSKKFEIIESLDKHVKSLIWHNLSLGDSFMNHLEPINLMADYYGEKYALYILFILHHIAWILLPAVVGTAIFVAQIVLAVKNVEEGQSFFMSYLVHVDQPINYFYILFISLWSTFYVESWKRK